MDIEKGYPRAVAVRRQFIVPSSSVQLISVLFILGYTLEVYNEYSRLLAQRLDYELRGYPPGCAGTALPDRSWSDWITGNGGFNEELCSQYTRIVSQSLIPNLFKVALSCITDVFIVPSGRMLNQVVWFLSAIRTSIGLVALLPTLALGYLSLLLYQRYINRIPYNVECDPRNMFEPRELKAIKQC